MANKKKLIASVVAASLAVSSFSALSVFAAAGDVLNSCQFEASDWGNPSRTDKFHGEYVEYAGTVAKPTDVSGQSLHFYSEAGQNVSVKFTLPTVTSAEVYDIDFDALITSAYQKANADSDQEEKEKFSYRFGFGDQTTDKDNNATANNLFDIKVIGDRVCVLNGADAVDTGLTTNSDGVWYHVSVSANTTTQKYKATITPYGADGALTADSAVKVSTSSFSGTPTSITGMYCESSRYDGGHKGYMNNYIDNFTVKEGVATVDSTVTIKYVDADGKEIKTATSDVGEVNSVYAAADSLKANFDAEEGYYYTYSTDGSTDSITVANDVASNVITLKFDKKAYVKVSANAVDSTGKVLAEIFSDKSYQDTSYKYFFDKTVAYEGKYYTATNISSYAKDIAVGAEDTVGTVEYKLDENIVFYKEAEDFENAIYEGNRSLDGQANYSGGSTRVPQLSGDYSEGFLTDAVAADGEYKLRTVAHSNSRGVAIGIVGADGTVRDILVTTDIGTIETEAVSLKAGEQFKIYCSSTNASWGSKQINNLDYVEVVKAALGTENKAPVVDVDSAATMIYSQNFDTLASGVSAMGTEDVAGDIDEKLSYKLGGRADKQDKSAIGVQNVAEENGVYDKAFVLTSGGTFSGVTRGPVITIGDAANVTLADLADGEKAVMAFAAKVTGTDHVLALVKDAQQEGSDGSGSYRNIISIKSGDVVTDDEWSVIKVAADKTGEYKVYVNDEVVETGEGMTTLPIKITNAHKKEGNVAGTVMLDNINIYKTTGDVVVLPVIAVNATTEGVSVNSSKATSVVVIKVSYDNGVVAKVELGKQNNLSAGDNAIEFATAPAAGDKILVWNGMKGIVPRCEATTVVTAE